MPRILEPSLIPFILPLPIQSLGKFNHLYFQNIYRISPMSLPFAAITAFCHALFCHQQCIPSWSFLHYSNNHLDVLPWPTPSRLFSIKQAKAVLLRHKSDPVTLCSKLSSFVPTSSRIKLRALPFQYDIHSSPTSSSCLPVHPAVDIMPDGYSVNTPSRSQAHGLCTYCPLYLECPSSSSYHHGPIYQEAFPVYFCKIDSIQPNNFSLQQPGSTLFPHIATVCMTSPPTLSFCLFICFPLLECQCTAVSQCLETMPGTLDVLSKYFWTCFSSWKLNFLAFLFWNVFWFWAVVVR